VSNLTSGHCLTTAPLCYVMSRYDGKQESHLIGRRDEDRTTHRFVRRYFLLRYTVSTCLVPVPRSVSEVAFHLDESRDRDLRTLTRRRHIYRHSTRNCFGNRETPQFCGAETGNLSLIPRLCAIGCFPNSERGCAESYYRSILPRLQLKFVIATATVQSKCSATTRGYSWRMHDMV